MDTMTMAGKKEKVNFLLPDDLYQRANAWSKVLDSTLSDLFREALATFLNNLEKERIAKEIEADCRLHYDLDKKLAAEWNKVAAEV